MPAAALAALLAAPCQAAQKHVIPPPLAAHSRPVDMGRMLRQELAPMIKRARAARVREAPIVTILDLESFVLAPATQPREAARAAAARLVLGALADPTRLDLEPLPLERTQELPRETSLRHSALLLRERVQGERGDARGEPSVREALARLETTYTWGHGLAGQAALLQAAYDGWVERWSHVWWDENVSPRRVYILEKPGQPETRIEKELHVPRARLQLEVPDDFREEEIHTAAVALSQAYGAMREPLVCALSAVIAWVAGALPLSLTMLPLLAPPGSDALAAHWLAFLSWSAASYLSFLLGLRRLRRKAAEIHALASGQEGRISVGEALGALRQLKERANKGRWVAWSAALTLALAGGGPRLGLWFIEQAWPFLRFPAWPYVAAMLAFLAAILAAGHLAGRGLGLRNAERLAEAAIEKLRQG